MKKVSLRLIIAFTTFAVGVVSVVFWLIGTHSRASHLTQLVAPVEVQSLAPADIAALRDKPPEPQSIYSARKNGCQVQVPELKKSDERLSDNYYHYINAEKYGFEGLREKTFPPNSIAVRIWVGGGIAIPRIFALERINGEWKAWRIKHTFNNKTKSFSNKKEFLRPKSDWLDVWNEFESREILSLPDASEVGDVAPGCDTEAIYIETIKSDHYRNYAYGQPWLSCLPEAQKVVQIYDVIQNEFNPDSH